MATTASQWLTLLFCFLSLSIQIFPHSSFCYPEDGTIIFFSTVTVYVSAWYRTPEDTFHQLTAHHATWVYSWWYMCPWSQHLYHMESLHLSGLSIIAAVLSNTLKGTLCITFTEETCKEVLVHLWQKCLKMWVRGDSDNARVFWSLPVQQKLGVHSYVVFPCPPLFPDLT
jgi:hypothetical protein